MTCPQQTDVNRAVSILLLASLPMGLQPALAADTEAFRVHATLREVRDPGAISLELPDGTTLTGRMTSDMRITGVKRAALADIHAGSYVGTAALPGPGGTLRALEVHIFPDSMRGAGEGHRPMDGGQDKTMTNGAVGVVGSAGPLALTVTYNGGEQRVTVDPTTPVVALEPGNVSLLMPGAKVVASGRREGDAITVDRLLVGIDGLDPPM